MDRILCEIKECVLLFHYPLSDSMNEEELGDIFHASNRCFLISWMLKLLDDSYKEVVDVEENRKNEEVLGNFVHELGFCTKKEHLPFMSGELDVKLQLNILYKMFTFIKCVKEPISQENRLSVSNEDINLLKKKSLNLFPMYGDIKTAKTTETDSVEVEIQDNLTESLTDDIIASEVHEDIRKLTEEVREHLPKLQLAAQNLPDDDKTSSKENIVFNPSSREMLSKCNEYMKNVTQFIQDINTIEEFIEYDPVAEKEENITSGSEMLNALFEEIFVTHRYQQMK
ncbi:hypothetical protein JTB14_008438 [Gonioctena quinquepunctata]|nr:hypothetical protein JTB14_008438 [Gonioctena quinquepunctata]